MTLITVAIPTFKRSTLLLRAVRSVLSQTFPGKMEVLVVENPGEETMLGVQTDAERICLELADARVRYV